MSQIIKNFIVPLVFFATIPVVEANLNLDKISHLDIESEVEQWDFYNEEALARQSQAETKKLNRGGPPART